MNMKKLVGNVIDAAYFMVAVICTAIACLFIGGMIYTAVKLWMHNTL